MSFCSLGGAGVGGLSVGHAIVEEGKLITCFWGGVSRPWKSEDVERHVEQQVRTGSVTAVDGSTVLLPVGDYPLSICCHSDSPGCVEIVKTTRKVVDRFNKEYGRE